MSHKACLALHPRLSSSRLACIDLKDVGHWTDNNTLFQHSCIDRWCCGVDMVLRSTWSWRASRFCADKTYLELLAATCMNWMPSCIAKRHDTPSSIDYTPTSRLCRSINWTYQFSFIVHLRCHTGTGTEMAATRARALRATDSYNTPSTITRTHDRPHIVETVCY